MLLLFITMCICTQCTLAHSYNIPNRGQGILVLGSVMFHNKQVLHLQDYDDHSCKIC